MKPRELDMGIERVTAGTDETRDRSGASTEGEPAGADRPGSEGIDPSFPPVIPEAESARSPSGRERLAASFRVRGGVSVAFIVVLTGLAFETFRQLTVLRPYVPHTTILLGLCGLVLYLVRRQGFAGQLSENYVLHFYLRPGYWAFVLLVSAGLIFSLCSVFLKEPLVAQARSRPAVEQPRPPEPEPVLLPEFPPIQVTGVLLNGAHSSAIMDGETVQLGEYIQGVKLVEVFAGGVVVELEGFQTTLPLNSVEPPSGANGPAH